MKSVLDPLAIYAECLAEEVEAATPLRARVLGKSERRWRVDASSGFVLRFGEYAEPSSALAVESFFADNADLIDCDLTINVRRIP